MNNLVKLNLHGDLGTIGEKWDFAISSVAEAIHALNSVTNNAFTNYFIKQNKLQAKYRILINGKDFYSPVVELNEDNAEKVLESQLVYKVDNLETIDIIPFIENENSKTAGIISGVLGVILIVVGAVLVGTGVAAPFGGALIMAGIGLVAGGIMALLTRMPGFQGYNNLDKAGTRSYLFGGPINIIGEGGAIPLGYGRALVGSQVISSSYLIQDYQTFRNIP